MTLVFAGASGDFVNRPPGVMLVADGMGVHVGKGYIYFAMPFSFVLELLNVRRRRARGVSRAASGPASSDV